MNLSGRNGPIGLVATFTEKVHIRPGANTPLGDSDAQKIQNKPEGVRFGR